MIKIEYVIILLLVLSYFMKNNFLFYVGLALFFYNYFLKNSEEFLNVNENELRKIQNNNDLIYTQIIRETSPDAFRRIILPTLNDNSNPNYISLTEYASKAELTCSCTDNCNDIIDERKKKNKIIENYGSILEYYRIEECLKPMFKKDSTKFKTEFNNVKVRPLTLDDLISLSDDDINRINNILARNRSVTTYIIPFIDNQKEYYLQIDNQLPKLNSREMVMNMLPKMVSKYVPNASIAMVYKYSKK